MLGEFCEGLSFTFKAGKREENCFLRAILYLLSGTEELHTYIKLKVTKFIKCNGTYKQKVEAYIKQSK